MSARRSIALVAVLCAWLAASVAAADGDADPAIPPGEEALIAGMLGRGLTLHDCTLAAGGVEYTVIKATYDCPAGEVALELGHPRNATATSTRTGQFAITLQSGSPPPGFAEALTSLIRAREADFQWGWAAHVDATGDDDAAE